MFVFLVICFLLQVDTGESELFSVPVAADERGEKLIFSLQLKSCDLTCLIGIIGPYPPR